MQRSIKTLSLVVALATTIGTISTQSSFAQASPDDIVGIWESDDGSFKFEMFNAGGTYAARVIFARPLLEPDGKTFKTDSLNPDPALRGRSLENIVFLSNLTWDASDNQWENGELYSGASGRTVSAIVTLVGGKMELRGYVGMPAFGQSTVLHREQ